MSEGWAGVWGNGLMATSAALVFQDETNLTYDGSWGKI